MPDKLTKELAQFERMTSAVLTVGAAVKDGMLKKQHLEALDNNIKQGAAKVKSMKTKVETAQVKLDELEATAKTVLVDAKAEAATLIKLTKAEAEYIVDTAKTEAKIERAKVTTLRGEVGVLEEEKLTLIALLGKEQSRIDIAKAKLLEALD